MPGSSDKGKSKIAEWFNRLNINSVLDIGPGEGTYSQLLRKRGQTWDAIEIFKPYVKKFRLRELYDHIYIADMRSYELARSYDLVIFGDVLEHVTNYEATKTLVRYLQWCNFAIVSLPLDAETGASAGTGDIDWDNLHELHRGQWTDSSFQETAKRVGATVVDTEKFPELAVYLIKKVENRLIDEEEVKTILPEDITVIKTSDSIRLWIRRLWNRMHSIRPIDIILQKMNAILQKEDEK